ncbi:MAG: cytochrome c [Acidimicrobiales bacterium]
MTSRCPTLSRLRSTAVVLAVVLAAVALGCGSGPGEDIALSPLAAEGRQIAAAQGCVSCHGQSGEGGVGPSWRGLAGSEVSLLDGTTAAADPAYLRRAITEPGADIVEGYAVRMPENVLTDGEVDAVVAYILELR